MDELDEFLAHQIDAWRPEFHYWLMWDRQPLDVQCVKHDCPDEDTLRSRRKRQEQIRRELEFIAYDCS